jgi:hypothetical protein
MFDNIFEKIEYEYRSFKSKMLRSSSQNIYASAKEIEIKKQIHNYFSKLNFKKCKDLNEEKLLMVPNLLDHLYLEVLEKKNNKRDNIGNVLYKLVVGLSAVNKGQRR